MKVEPVTPEGNSAMKSSVLEKAIFLIIVSTLLGTLAAGFLMYG